MVLQQRTKQAVTKALFTMAKTRGTITQGSSTLPNSLAIKQNHADIAEQRAPRRGDMFLLDPKTFKN